MADPIVKKVTDLIAADSVAADDLIVIVDVSEAIAANKTKKALARLITLYNSTQITDGIVINSKIATDAVTAVKLATDAVETAKIKDANVTTAKIANGAVTAVKLATDAVETAKIKDANVTTAKIATDAVETAKIKDGAVTAGKLSIGLVDAEASNLIYIQLFQPDEIIVSTTGRSFWFVSSFFTGKKIKKMGLGVMTPGTSNTTVALGSLGSVAGNGFIEVDKDVSLTAGVKHSINITAGSGNPKGLDFWFIIGK